MNIPTLEDLGNLEGKRVLVRCDFNVPLEGGVITDDLRIKSALPTLRYLVEAGATVTACSHLGRPKGKPASEFALEPVRKRLQELLPEVQLMENLRFNPGETDNSSEFVSELIAGQDIYVNDAFGASHRSHASIVGPPAFLPSAAGRLLEKEVHVLNSLRENPKRPVVGIMGGSKVSDKLGVIEALLDVVDELIVGGGMCFTFLAAKGNSVGASLLEENMVEKCRGLLATYDSIRLPLDVTALSPEGVIGDPSAGGEVRQMGTSIPEGWMGLDIGPGTAVEFCDIISEARTVLWNGPMGVFEDSRFSAGTRTIAEAVAECRGFTVVGGGDSAAAAKLFGVDGEMNHVSTGGGATLELIEKGDLPGLSALRDSQRV
mgnify:FL=1